ncbi:MAG: peptidoglycan DD-metalloendopeptidase family protein [Proteobacteria bacterium]|nr:peptidoglycan DD-metalloendopeptidase family protein [Pseudomonadota bacterium]
MSGIDPTASGATGIADRLRDAAKEGDTEGVKEAAKKFEQYFVTTMMKEMRKASGGEDGLLAGSEMETFSALFDEEIAGRISEGPGIGLASMIERSLASAYGDAAASGTDSVGGASNRLGAPALAASLRDGMAWPLPADEPGSISSHFGHRANPMGTGHGHHGGLDIAAPEGTAVLSMAEGRVIRAGRSSTYGNVVDVQHDDGTVTRYAHQSRLDVAVGQEVSAGEQLGAVGSTGRSSGAHLHIEVIDHGEKVDPYAFLKRD